MMRSGPSVFDKGVTSTTSSNAGAPRVMTISLPTPMESSTTAVTLIPGHAEAALTVWSVRTFKTASAWMWSAPTARAGCKPTARTRHPKTVTHTRDRIEMPPRRLHGEEHNAFQPDFDVSYF